MLIKTNSQDRQIFKNKKISTGFHMIKLFDSLMKIIMCNKISYQEEMLSFSFPINFHDFAFMFNVVSALGVLTSSCT